MDLFSQLDQLETLSSSEISSMIRFRTRFHKNLIYSKLSLNPAKSLDEVAAAVLFKEPSRFLPQPWPPYAVTDNLSLLALSLAKMKAIVNVGLGLPESNSAALLTVLISEWFPAISAIPANTSAVISCEARIGENGEVTYSCDSSQATALHSSLLTQADGKHGYIKAMQILAMQKYLESLPTYAAGAGS